MSSLQQEFRDLESGHWAEINPSRCPCHGSGWLCSDLDTWHRCPIHGHGVPHPEDESESASAFDFRAHTLKCQREAFATFLKMARDNGFTDDFNAACIKASGKPVVLMSPSMWVDAAEEVSNEIAYEATEVRAHKAGFSCGLEMRLTEEAARERYFATGE